MSVKRTGQLEFGEIGLARRGGGAALERVSALVDWGGSEPALAGLREDGPGRPGYRPLLLFKALLLQAWYGLSDAELEFRLGDSLAFGRFVGLGLEDEVRTTPPCAASATGWCASGCWSGCSPSWMVSSRGPASCSDKARCWTPP